jgi:ABC-type transport system involved in multi-copper enzyme maturation permease subunit
VNITLIRAFWLERFTSPVRLLLVFMTLGLSLLITFFHTPVELPTWEWTMYFTLILGAGIIGRDLSTGVLQLILARPVRRVEYVFSRWAALGTAALGLTLIGWIIALPFSVSGGNLTIPKVLVLLTEHLLTAYGLAAVITAFSALVAGFGDLALWLAGLMISFSIGAFGTFAKQSWARRLAGELIETLIPHFSIDRLSADGSFHYTPIIAWFSTVFLSLLLATVAMNRKELSYATAG